MQLQLFTHLQRSALIRLVAQTHEDFFNVYIIQEQQLNIEKVTVHQ